MFRAGRPGPPAALSGPPERGWPSRQTQWACPATIKFGQTMPALRRGVRQQRVPYLYRPNSRWPLHCRDVARRVLPRARAHPALHARCIYSALFCSSSAAASLHACSRPPPKPPNACVLPTARVLVLRRSPLPLPRKPPCAQGGSSCRAMLAITSVRLRVLLSADQIVKQLRSPTDLHSSLWQCMHVVGYDANEGSRPLHGIACCAFISRKLVLYKTSCTHNGCRIGLLPPPQLHAGCQACSGGGGGGGLSVPIRLVNRLVIICLERLAGFCL